MNQSKTNIKKHNEDIKKILSSKKHPTIKEQIDNDIKQDKEDLRFSQMRKLAINGIFPDDSDDDDDKVDDKIYNMEDYLICLIHYKPKLNVSYEHPPANLKKLKFESPFIWRIFLDNGYIPPFPTNK
jgi:hypothetical protein